MKEIVRNVLKSAAVMFTVGVVLALGAPVLAKLAGVSMEQVGIGSHWLWSGTFFGAFGAVNALVAPTLDFVFGDKDKANSVDSSAEAKLQARQVNINIQQAPGKTQGQAVLDSKWGDRIKAERIAALFTDNRRPGG